MNEINFDNKKIQKEVIFLGEEGVYNSIFKEMKDEFRKTNIKFTLISDASNFIDLIRSEAKEKNDIMVFLTHSQFRMISDIYEKTLGERDVSIKDKGNNYHIKIIAKDFPTEFFQKKIVNFMEFDPESKNHDNMYKRTSKQKVNLKDLNDLSDIGLNNQEIQNNNLDNNLTITFDDAGDAMVKYQEPINLKKFSIDSKDTESIASEINIFSESFVNKMQREFTNSKRNDLVNRYLLTIVALFVLYGITSFKAQIQDNFNIHCACDINSNWTEIKNEYQIKFNITNINLNKCEGGCDWENYFYSKIFHLNYYMLYTINAFYSSLYLGIIKSSKFFLFTIATSIIFFLTLADIIFFKNLKVSQFSSNIMIALCFSFFCFITKDKQIIKKGFYTAGALIFYFSCIKFFFEEYYFFLFKLFSKDFIEKYFLAIFCKILKYLFTLMTSSNIFEDAKEFFKLISCNFLSIFEFISIANKHNIVIEHGIYSTDFWISMLVSFLLDLDNKILILKKLSHKIKNYFRREKEDFKLSGVYQVMIGNKLTLQIFTIGYYFILINTRFFEFANIPLVDCKSKPIAEISPILPEHTLLFFILIFEIVLQGVIRKIVIKIFYGDVEYGMYPKINSTNKCIAYFTVLYGACVNFGLPGLYSILYSEKQVN